MAGGIFWPFLGLQLYDLQASYFQIARDRFTRELGIVVSFVFFLASIFALLPVFRFFRKDFTSS